MLHTLAGIHSAAALIPTSGRSRRSLSRSHSLLRVVQSYEIGQNRTPGEGSAREDSLSQPGYLQNGPPKPASEFTIKGGEKVNLEIDGIEAGTTITWDIVVGGWDVCYLAEYVPSAEGGYTIAVEKARRVQAAAEEPVHNVFTAR